jgi:hypothetical protein
MASTINTSRSESFLVVGGGSHTVGGGTYTVDGGTLMATDGTQMIDSSTIADTTRLHHHQAKQHPHVC